GRTQVHIVSDQRRAGAYCGYARGWMDSRFTKVGPARFIGSNLGADAFKLSLAHGREVLTLRFSRGFLIEVDRDSKLAPHALAARPGQRDAFIHGHSRDWHERNDVGGSHTRVLAGVLVQID